MTAAEEQEQRQRQEEQRHLQAHQYGGPSYYGTFQENPSFPQPVHPSQYVPTPSYVPPPGYERIEEYTGPLPCCGLGVGWCLFIIGFLTFSLPWFVGAFIFICLKHDPREHVGFAACTIAAGMALLLGCGRGINIW